METLRYLRNSYAKIDLDRYKQNIEYLKSKSNSEIIAIVKANGYGHGAENLAKHLQQSNTTKFFGVATIEEGVSLRKHLGSDANIIVLGFVSDKFFYDVVSNNLILTIFDEHTAENYQNYLIKQNLKMPVVLKVDTGMNRLGYSCELDYFQFINSYKNFDILMVMSHLSSADDDDDYTIWQISNFNKFINKYNIKQTSLFNSSAILKFDNTYTFTRPGIASYGYVYGIKSDNLKPVMSLFSKIVHIKRIKKGESVSYNRRFKAERDMVIGVLPIGYADGYLRFFTNKAEVFIKGFKSRVLGTICMDMTMIDLTNIPESIYNEEVELLGDNISGYKWGSWGDTIIYELLCGISPRIPRVYVSNYEYSN